MNFFDEISKEKKDFPKIHSVKNEMQNYSLNFYQGFAIGMFVICFFLGIILGNLFATCDATSYFYSNVCVVTKFNFSLMISVWFISLLVSIGIFSIGHIIALLTEINEKLGNFKR